MIKYYAGIGSRNTPIEVQHTMTNIATWLEKKGYILRSGGAKGADTAFEKGVYHNKEIYYANNVTDDAITIAKRYHPAWNHCSTYARKLHGRNAFQVLGQDLKTPVEFVVCWTPDGAESHNKRQYETGGTGTAISIANKNGIRVFNLANSNTITEFREYLRNIN